MRIFKILLKIITLGYFVFAQTPINLESQAISHNQISLNWNTWDPSDSYYDAIVYISDIQDIGNENVTMDFSIVVNPSYQNPDQMPGISKFQLSIISDLSISNIVVSGGVNTTNYEFNIDPNTTGGNFIIEGEGPSFSSSGLLFQLVAEYNLDQEDVSELTLDYQNSYFQDVDQNQLTLRWKNVIWDVEEGLENDDCGDGLCTINENVSICPEDCDIEDINYTIYYVNTNPQQNLIDTTVTSLIVDDTFDNINFIPQVEYCFQVQATEPNYPEINQISNTACSYTQCQQTEYCDDNDLDGWGNPNELIESCSQPTGYVANCSDHDDDNYCILNQFDDCGICGGTNYCNYPLSNDSGNCVCNDGETDCWIGDAFDCEGVCFGMAEPDDCEVCNGGNNTLDCFGNCNGNAKIDHCGICDGNSSSCFPYLEGPTNLSAQGNNLQVGLSWNPVDLCDPYLFDDHCDDWGSNEEDEILLTPMIINNNTDSIIDVQLTIDHIEDDGAGTVSFHVSLQSDRDIYFSRLNLDVYDIYDTLSIFQDFPNLDDFAENGEDCFGGNSDCIQFGQPSGGIIDDEDYDFSAYTETNGRATFQSFSGGYVPGEALVEGTILFKMDAIYDPDVLTGKDLFVTHTLEIQSESDELYVMTENYDLLHPRFNTSIWQVGFGLASIYTCGDGICQEPFEESGIDTLSGSDGYPSPCSTGEDYIFLGAPLSGDCVPAQYCGDGTCQEVYTDGAPHPWSGETWENCNLNSPSPEVPGEEGDCESCGNGDCDWSAYEAYCDINANADCNGVPFPFNPNAPNDSGEEDWFYCSDCSEPMAVEYIIYKQIENETLTQQDCQLNNNLWWNDVDNPNNQGCFTQIATTMNTYYNDIGLDFNENYCYLIAARQGDLTTMNGMIGSNGNLDENINGNSDRKCATTDPQIGELPVIREVADMPEDQGGYIKLKVQRSYADNGTVDSLYQVFRKFESGQNPDEWVYVGSFPGNGQENYYFISPTEANAILPDSPNYHYFKIYYRGYLDSSAFNNFPEYGYSLDNIPPYTPSGLTTQLGSAANGYEDQIILGWTGIDENVVTDWSHYNIYRNYTQIASTINNSYHDQNFIQLPQSGFNFGENIGYQITAVDIHTNESDPSEIQSTSYGQIGNLSFQDVFLMGQSNLGHIDDENLIDILDLTMLQSILCHDGGADCASDGLNNPSDYELWAGNLNFDYIEDINGQWIPNIDITDLTCLVFRVQNGTLCPANNVYIINDLNYNGNTIAFNVQNINSFVIEFNEKIQLLNHNLTKDWNFIHGKSKIYAYSKATSEFSGKIKLNFKNSGKVKSIYVNSYK